MIVKALIVGAFVGIVVGSLGAGGGILSVPILVYVLGQEPHQATGLSLIIVGLTAAVSLVTRMRSGNVAWREGSLFALAGLVGTWAGSTLGPFVSARALLLSFCALLGLVALFMVRAQLSPAHSSPPASTNALSYSGAHTPSRISTAARVIALATLTGFLTGFFGVGGGFAIVPALHLALPNEESLGHVPARHADHSRLRLGLTTSGWDPDDHARGRGFGRTVRHGFDGRWHRGSQAHQESVESGARPRFRGSSRDCGHLDADRHPRLRARETLVVSHTLSAQLVVVPSPCIEVSPLRWPPLLLPGPRTPWAGAPGRVPRLSLC